MATDSGLSLAGNLVKPLLSLYGAEWRERGYGLWELFTAPLDLCRWLMRDEKVWYQLPVA